MPKYRKKPVVIEAMKNEPLGGGEVAPAWLTDNAAVRCLPDGSISIRTLEGTMIANPGDWIIRGTKGEIYPCKPEIFAEIYEAVED